MGSDSRGTAALVLSGKGGVGKTFWQLLLAGEASLAGLSVLLVDADPERNLSARFGVPRHARGLGAVLEVTGVAAGDQLNIDAAVKALGEEIRSTPWDGVDILPAGASLGNLAQVNISDTWLLRDIFEAAGLYARHDVIFIDTAGRTGSLVTLTMYAADVTYAPISPNADAVRKAKEAKARSERIQRAHPLRWAGVVLSGFDHLRVGMDSAIMQEAQDEFGDEVRAIVPRRATVHEAFHLCERLGDRPDVASASLAEIFRNFLVNDLISVNESTAVGGGQS